MLSTYRNRMSSEKVTIITIIIIIIIRCNLNVCQKVNYNNAS